MRENDVYLVVLILLALAVAPSARGTDPVTPQDTNTLPPSVLMTAKHDHQRILELLHITSLRPGANCNNPQAPNFLRPGEKRTIKFTLGSAQLSLINAQGRRVVEPGESLISVGGKQPGFDGRADSKYHRSTSGKFGCRRKSSSTRAQVKRRSRSR